eukprot:IDg15662t1
MHICQQVATPMEVSSLMYLMIGTRPDLAFAVSTLLALMTEDYCSAEARASSRSDTVIQTGVNDSRFASRRADTFSCWPEALWLSRLLYNVHGDAKPKPITIHTDNSGSIATAQSTSINQRNKHVDIQYHFVRDNVASGKMMLEYIS